jgi:hypothetical protein
MEAFAAAAGTLRASSPAARVPQAGTGEAELKSLREIAVWMRS